MTPELHLLTDILSPTLAATFFLTFALYFFQVPQRGERRWLGFPYYLLGFGLFLFSRPLQLLLGPYPWPTIVVCLRMMLLFGLCGPLILWGGLSITGRRPSLKKVFGIGIGFGLLFIVFTLLGTSSSKVFFEMGSLTAYDNDTPALLAPWYAREVTLALQVIAGGFFYLIAAWLALRESVIQRKLGKPHRQSFWFGLGTLTFGASFIIGSIFKAWWVYYIATVPSAAMTGLGVLADIRLLNSRADRVLPFLREELFHLLSSGAEDDRRLQELMDLLGKRELPDTVLVIDHPLSVTAETLMDAREKMTAAFQTELRRCLPDRHLFLSIGPGRFAICIYSGEEAITELAQQLFEAVLPSLTIPFVMGVGNRYEGGEVRQSYLEAVCAVRIAHERRRALVAYTDVAELQIPGDYPLTERDEFIRELQNGNPAAAVRRFRILADRLSDLCERDVHAFGNRLIELWGLATAAAMSGGADPSETLEVSDLTQKDLPRLKSIDRMRGCFEKAVESLPFNQSEPKVSEQSPTQRAKALIARKFAEELTLDAVAKAVSVSPSHLQRLLRQQSLTFSGLLTSTRLTEAKELLASTSDSITGIAFSVGFKDSNYFSTVFKKNEGITPRQYRKESSCKSS